MGRGLLTWRQRGQLWLRLGIRLLLFFIAALLIKHFLKPLLSIFTPFLFALATAAMLNPAIRWMQRKLGWNRRLLSALILFALFATLGGTSSYLLYCAATELISLVQDWPALFEQAQQTLEQLNWGDWVSLWWTNGGQRVVSGLVSDFLSSAADYAKQLAVALPALTLALVVFVTGAYFLTADYPYLYTKILQHMDDDTLDFFSQVKQTAWTAFGGYLRAQLFLSLGVFLILAVGFAVTQLPYAVLFALALAILDFIPIIGAGTVMVPWAAIAFLMRDYHTALVMSCIWGVVAIFRRVAEPKFVGQQTGLSPILSLVSIYAGMKLAGVTGMILGPVLTLIVLNLAGLGMLHNLRLDLSAASRDIAAILRKNI